MKPDFSGYATKAGIRCSDGRTITPDAFKDQHQQRVPLVWQHGHSDPKNVLGHCILEHRDDGMYAYAFFNGTDPAVHAATLVEKKDINHLSIWANNLIEKAGQVLHGIIREVSLVLAGANPGAVIESVTLRHSDGALELQDDEGIIHTGLPLDVEMWHAADDDEGDDDEGDEDEDTIQDVYDSMNEEQKTVLHYMVGQALEQGKSAAQSATNDGTTTTTTVLTNFNNGTTNSATSGENKEGKTMVHHNVFESGGKERNSGPVISHDDMQSIFENAKRVGSLKTAVMDYVKDKGLQHGINDIDVLFPEAKTINDTPEWISRRMEWVADLLGAVRKTPFSRIKTINADITVEEARAKGYVKGSLKKEEFFGVASRVTTPTTIYKKQALDRDDMLDITDFDVVVWLKAEMRLMLDEELARAILLGDGRDIASEDKINEQNIRPILKDHELYVTTINVNIDDANSRMTEVSDAMMMNRFLYKGTGNPTFYTTEYWIARFLTTRDLNSGQRIWKNLEELATELRVARIVPVEVMLEYPDVVGIMVNPVDYVLGADKGGQVSMFDQFDIDYNKEKFLIETRVSGALVKIKSGMVVMRTAGDNVLATPEIPTFDAATGALTIPTVTGVVYKHGVTTITTGGSPYTVDPGDTWVVDAVPDTGYYFASSEGDQWSFTADE